MATYIVIGLIGIYAAAVIYKKYKNIKAGKFCSCNCESCSGCSQEKKK